MCAGHIFKNGPRTHPEPWTYLPLSPYNITRIQISKFCGKAKRSHRTPSLCEQEGRHVTSCCLLRATTHSLARSIISSIKLSIYFHPPATPKFTDRWQGCKSKGTTLQKVPTHPSRARLKHAPRTHTRVFNQEALCTSARHAGCIPYSYPSTTYPLHP